MNIATCIIEQARRRPDAPAIITRRGRDRRVLTFGAIDQRTARLVACFRKRGLRSDDRALVLQPVSSALYEILIALFRIGAVAVFPDPSALRRHLAHACDIAQPKLLVGPPLVHGLRLLSRGLRQIPLAASTGSWVPFAFRTADADACAPDPEPAATPPESPALITFTSGSTGIPKAIARSHRLLLAQHTAIARALRPVEGSASLVTLPMFTLANLASGVATVLPDTDITRPARIDAGALVSQIAENDVRQLILSPVVCDRLADIADGPITALASVAEVFTGGGPVFLDTIDRLARVMPTAAIHAAYGSSEAEPIAHVAASAIDPAMRDAVACGRGLPVGRPVPEAQVAILPDRFGQPIGPYSPSEFAFTGVGSGEAGEIVVTGAHVVGSYVDGRGDAETKFRVGETVWHRTGDAGRFDADGRLWLLGRCSGRIQHAGQTTYPLAIEAAARTAAPGANLACIEQDGEPTLVIERGDADRRPDLLAIVKPLGISDIKIVDRIPMDRRHNSKVDYPALKALIGKLG